MPRTRLCLVTPSPLPAGFAESLKSALDAGDVASVLIGPGGDRRERDAAVDVTQRAGAAAILVGIDDSGQADGIHLEVEPSKLAAARRRLGDAKALGAGGLRSRHDAMLLGEVLPDYLFFGRFDGDDEPDIHPKALELAAWWSELFEIPAIVMGGADPVSAGTAAAAGIEFVALGKAVWNDPGGPAGAVTTANRELDRRSRK